MQHPEDWFTRLVGFDESGGPDEVRRRLRVRDGALVSDASPRRAAIGTLTLPSLSELRHARTTPGRSSLTCVTGEARAMHRDPSLNGALFQAASQFNLLEMASPDLTPEDGLARYEADRTQGPACAMAAGAATVYRNYLVPVQGRPGQGRGRQLDALRDLGAALAGGTGLPVAKLWEMRNGYALCSPEGLTAIARFLRSQPEERLDALRGLLRIGLVRDAEVTDSPPGAQLVSQALCSALPVAYSPDPCHPDWEPFARLVLEASYEATLLAGSLTSAPVLLTSVGGGVFGNEPAWIEAAIDRALSRVGGLDVRLVSYGQGCQPEFLGGGL